MSNFKDFYFVYIDESKDQGKWFFSALWVPCSQWNAIFDRLKELRRNLSQSYGIRVRKELHATDFLGGRGRPSKQKLSKEKCAFIFKLLLEEINRWNEIKLFNSVCEKENWALERLLTRINRTLTSEQGLGLIICDSGKEEHIQRLIRRMRIYNPIPSKKSVSEVWADTQQPSKNIPLDRIIEDPVFRDSKNSYFIQLIDFCVYAFMRNECRLPSKEKYQIGDAFDLLREIYALEACTSDPRGIIR